MKTVTTIIVMALIAWIGFVCFQDDFGYDHVGLLVSPAIFGIVVIVMYRVLRGSIADDGDEISTQIGLFCTTAFIIAAPYSVLAWLVIMGFEEYKPDWIPMAIVILLGIFVFVVFYLNIDAQIRKEKTAIAQGKRSHLEYLENKQNFIYACVIYSWISICISGFIYFPMAESNIVWMLIPLLLFLGSFVLLFSFVLYPHGQLEEKIALAEAKYLKSEINAQQQHQRAEKAQNKKLVSTAADFLEENPETDLNNLQSIIPEGDVSHMEMGAKVALQRLLEQHKFEQARSLLDYYEADEFHLLPIMEALDHHTQTGALDLSPQTYKIVLEDNETAYQKLPCNWQNIHTYLAPLEDGIDQSDILDTGNIYITDQRVFFVGKKGSETVYLKDIAYIDLKEDALQFFRDEGLSEIFAFPTAHHAVYAELVIRALMDAKA